MAWRPELEPSCAAVRSAAALENGPDDREHAFLADVPPSPGERRLAFVIIALSALTFVVALPFVRVPLVKVPAFMSSYELALAINDLITAVLLFGQFSHSRSRALLALACGYLFDALIIVPHVLTFPGAFSDTGLLGAGDQTTAWLYVFWHGGFPLFVLAYAWCRVRFPDPVRGNTALIAALAAIAVAAAVGAFTLLATWGMELLPVVVRDGNYSRLVTTGVSPVVWMLSLVALIVLWRCRRRSVLDLWLIVVMCAWLCDIALSAVIGSSRYDLGFYAGRSYGLMAASFVLAVLLLETNELQRRLAAARGLLVERARQLERRVRDRTEELRRSNESLQVEIAERRHAEQELLQARAFLNVVIESTPAMLLVTGAVDRKCVLINRTGEELLGCDRSEIVGKSLQEVLSPQDAALIELQEQQALQSGKPYEMYEHRLTSRTQGVRLVRSKRAPVLDETGSFRYVLGCSEDVTDQRRTEEELRQSQKMNAIGELTGGLAHDFNNLLGIVIGNLDLLKEVTAGDADKECLVDDALAAALSGSELTRRLLAFARRQPLQPERVDLNELVGGISRLLTRTLGQHIEIRLNLDSSISRIVADRAQLETAITNLANNARDAMPKGGKLFIATRSAGLDQDYALQHSELEPGDYVELEVSDTGCGMTPDVVKRIFEPFYTTKGLGKGTGLGLSMVFGFLKQSGGHINVYSEPGRGTTFRLYFRPATGDAAAPVIEAPALQPGRAASERILVVEDNHKLREVVVRQLTSHGFDVVEIDNAKAALDLIDGGCGVDLLFTDIVMPGTMDGFTLAREVMARWPRLKVLLTSGFSGLRLAEMDELGPNVRLLNKPYRKDDLIRTVREVLDDTVPVDVALRA